MEVRYYLVKKDSTQGFLTDDEFMDLAEQQGTVFSERKFMDVINNGEIDMHQYLTNIITINEDIKTDARIKIYDKKNRTDMITKYFLTYNNGIVNGLSGVTKFVFEENDLNHYPIFICHTNKPSDIEYNPFETKISANAYSCIEVTKSDVANMIVEIDYSELLGIVYANKPYDIKTSEVLNLSINDMLIIHNRYLMDTNRLNRGKPHRVYDGKKILFDPLV